MPSGGRALTWRRSDELRGGCALTWRRSDEPRDGRALTWRRSDELRGGRALTWRRSDELRGAAPPSGGAACQRAVDHYVDTFPSTGRHDWLPRSNLCATEPRGATPVEPGPASVSA